MTKILTYPNEILFQTAEEVTLEELPELKPLMRDMVFTMQRHGGVGLAAPQVGISKRIIVWIDHDRNTYAGINPVITTSAGKFKSKEGCLSVPNIERIIKRKRTIMVSALNINGKPIMWHLKNKDASIVQHEIDHLDGITIICKRKRVKDGSYLRKMRRR